jgi:hypothetical protein
MEMNISGVSVRQLIAELPGRHLGGIEFLPSRPTHSAAQFTWRLPIPGRGVYLGPADEYIDENGKKQRYCADPDTFVPESLVDRLD